MALSGAMEPPGSRIPLPAHFPKEDEEEENADDTATAMNGQEVDELEANGSVDNEDIPEVDQEKIHETTARAEDGAIEKGFDNGLLSKKKIWSRKSELVGNAKLGREQVDVYHSPLDVTHRTWTAKDFKRRSKSSNEIAKSTGSKDEQAENDSITKTSRKSWSQKEAQRSLNRHHAGGSSSQRSETTHNSGHARRSWSEKQAKRRMTRENNLAVTVTKVGNSRGANISEEIVAISAELGTARFDPDSDDHDLVRENQIVLPIPLQPQTENGLYDAVEDGSGVAVSQDQSSTRVDIRENLESLVVAKAVDDMSYRNLPTAQQVDNTQIKPRRAIWNNLGILLAMTLTVIVGIALLAVFLVGGFDGNEPSSFIEIGNNNNGTNGTRDPTNASTLSPESYLLSFLPIHTIEKIQFSPGSPQSKAFHWLVNNTLLYNYSEHRLLQRYGLATFYYSTGGDDWHDNTNWLSDLNECEWHSKIYSQFNCSELFLNISQENFPYRYFYVGQNNLNGSIPEELYLLTQLESIILENNFLSGGISSNIGHLTKLVHLNLPNNGLVSSLPSEIGLLKSLQFLFAYANDITGSIPTTMANATSLTYVSLLNNQLTGTIPSELGLLSFLLQLALAENQLTSTLPTELAELTSLTNFAVDKNLLTGTVPPLAMPNLTSLLLAYNNFTGPIPSELGLARQIDQINLFSNQFTGKIPSEFGLMTSVTELGLYRNSLQGPIPSELGLLKNLKSFWLSENQLTGSFPTELCQMTAVDWIGLEENLLTGPLPSEIGLLQNLTVLDLWDNQFSSTLPSEIGLLEQLINFDIEINQITGPIPSEVGSCQALVQLVLNSNPMSGTLHTELGQLTRLTGLLAHTNFLSGTIPSEIGMLKNLVGLVMHTSSLSGAIPSELGMLQSVELLISLWNSNLTGSLPSELGNLSNMTLFKAQNNNIIGAIPSSFGRLQKLDILDLSTNGLLGTIPKSLGSLVKNGSLSMLNVSSNPGLKGQVPSLLCSLNSELAFDCTDMLCGCSCECAKERISSNIVFPSVLVNVSKPGN